MDCRFQLRTQYSLRSDQFDDYTFQLGMWYSQLRQMRA